MDETTAKALKTVRAATPSIHCITNSVAQNFTANVLLALGAQPSMTHDADEVGEFVASANGLLINLGTLDAARRRSIDLAITSAEGVAIPWVLDPVMVDRSHWRAESAAMCLLRHPTVLRANEREAALMAGSADYLLKVVARDSEDFARIHRQHLARLPGVAQMQSSFALKTVFKTTALPV